MGPRMQALLLRFLETGEIQRVGAERPQQRLDVRVIAATNRESAGGYGRGNVPGGCSIPPKLSQKNSSAPRISRLPQPEHRLLPHFRVLVLSATSISLGTPSSFGIWLNANTAFFSPPCPDHL